jgi:hypothetical protein
VASWRHSTESNSVGALGQVSIVSHSYQTYFGFPRSDLNLDCGLRDHVMTRFASVGIRARLQNKVISFCYFRSFSVPLSFSVFASIFLFFVSASSKQKKKVIFHLVTVSNYISILKRKKKKKERQRGIS